MADGVDTRAQIDTETVRGLQLANGGLAAGLLTVLPTVIRDPGFRDLGVFMILGAGSCGLGMALTLVHNRFRRKCSLEYARAHGNRGRPYTSKWLVWCQTVPGEPQICTKSIIAMWLSLAFFLLGGAAVGTGFLRVPSQKPEPTAPCWVLQHIGDHDYKFNRCTGVAEAYTGK